MLPSEYIIIVIKSCSLDAERGRAFLLRAVIFAERARESVRL
jgi:hypothetical protein